MSDQNSAGVIGYVQAFTLTLRAAGRETRAYGEPRFLAALHAGTVVGSALPDGAWAPTSSHDPGNIEQLAPTWWPGRRAVQFGFDESQWGINVDVDACDDAWPVNAGGQPMPPDVIAIAPLIGFAPTRSGQGYWQCAVDGAVYAFGDAQYHGGANDPAHPLAAPITGMAATPSGGGYWLFAADGGVFAYGDAPYLGHATHR